MKTTSPTPTGKMLMSTEIIRLAQATLALVKELSPETALFCAPEEISFFAGAKKCPEQEELFPKRDYQSKIKTEALLQVEAAPPHRAPMATPPPSQVRNSLQKLFPHLQLHEAPLADTKARQIAQGWEERISDAEVILLTFCPSAEELVFVKNLAKAIQTHLKPIKILSGDKIEREKRWELFLERNSFSLLIATPSIEQFPGALSFYKGFPGKGESFLNKTPLLILSPHTTYTTTREAKQALWTKLCQMLRTE